MPRTRVILATTGVFMLGLVSCDLPTELSFTPQMATLTGFNIVANRGEEFNLDVLLGKNVNGVVIMGPMSSRQQLGDYWITCTSVGTGTLGVYFGPDMSATYNVQCKDPAGVGN